MPRPMKDSGVEWIGEIPADWDVLNLGAVTETMRNGYVGPTKDLFVDDGIKYIQSLHIKDGRINFSRHEYYVSETWANIHPKIKKNDVLIVQTGDIGNVGLVTDEYDNCNCHALIIATPRTDLIFPNYLTYYLRSAVGRELLLFYKTGALLPHLNSGKIKFANICVPPLDEQQRIATFLDGECARIDSVIEKTRASIVEYKKLKQAIITRAVTKGMRPARPMKDSGVEWLGEIPTDWEVQRIKNVAQIYGRIGFRGYTTDDLVKEGEGAITLSPSNLFELKLIYDKCSYISWEKYKESPEIQVEKGDILFVKTGSSYGKSSIVSDLPLQATINPQLVVFKNITIDNRFFLYFLQTPSIKSEIEGIVSGGTIPTMTQEKMKNFHLCIPPRAEQKEIAQYLDAKTAVIDLLVEKKNQLVTELERLKKSLIFEYVTGKKAVPQ